LIFAPTIFLAKGPVATASIYQKILWFVFYLIYVLALVAVHLITELTKFELIITIFEQNDDHVSPTLRINVLFY